VWIEGAYCGSVGGEGEVMEWARALAHITGTVGRELLLRNEYVATTKHMATVGEMVVS
jgi:hypothetical protein